MGSSIESQLELSSLSLLIENSWDDTGNGNDDGNDGNDDKDDNEGNEGNDDCNDDKDGNDGNDDKDGNDDNEGNDDCNDDCNDDKDGNDDNDDKDGNDDGDDGDHNAADATIDDKDSNEVQSATCQVNLMRSKSATGTKSDAGDPCATGVTGIDVRKSITDVHKAMKLLEEQISILYDLEITLKTLSVIKIQSFVRGCCVYKTTMRQLLVGNGIVMRLFKHPDMFPILVEGQITDVQAMVTIRYVDGKTTMSDINVLDIQDRPVIRAYVTEAMPNYFNIQKKRTNISFIQSTKSGFSWYVPSFYMNGSIW